MASELDHSPLGDKAESVSVSIPVELESPLSASGLDSISKAPQIVPQSLLKPDICLDQTNPKATVATVLSPQFSIQGWERYAKATAVISPDLITRDWDALRFNAAAYHQLHVPFPHVSDPDVNRGVVPISSLLISSPYNLPGHYLNLSHLDMPNLLFAKALTVIKPTTLSYATTSFMDALNFNTVLMYLKKLADEEGFEWKEQSFYVVVFRSQLKEKIDKEWLWKLDAESHKEAGMSGGLLKYWFGRAGDGVGERRNLATCFWRSKEDARKGGLGPWHKKARLAAREMYESFAFTTHQFTVLDNVSGFTFADWKE
ncbi:hypothetical protein GQ43DRAFT_269318 [Delitschia confertaspora ATCC 74209]|uniref:Uncharacterized protein n=1 Tax=Delitschia confertaspora ATCC 74209 TaxID=1513339 RepID=A0A9P4MZV5_9PLEO|nr:hypothetical protein GQ43DRAFT_269318 [Delitschia confertaspora ATCC 74209]